MSESTPKEQESIERESELSPRPIKIERSWFDWNDGAVTHLATGIREDRRFDDLPILADALEEAGCQDERILNHCRNHLNHTGECWVLESLANKELDPRIKTWMEFYDTYFKQELEVSEIEFPERTEEERKEFTLPIVIQRGLTYDQIWEACKQQFNCWRYDQATSLDELIKEDERTNHASGYAIWARDTKEADPQNANRSAEDIENQDPKPKTMTLKERLIHELEYFHRTQHLNDDPNSPERHLDIEHTTLCVGSRDGHGGVPYVYWSPSSREVNVDRARPDDRSAFLRARSVVS